MQQPIIFIGMHRSGTSMLGRLLERLGLFTGTQQDVNSEALFFQKMNEWLMEQSGARWDVPGATNYLWDNEDLLVWIEDYLSRFLDGPRATKFLGFKRYLIEGKVSQLNMHWGWKDPRNTFTLPMWLRIFPEAKIIYIERNGVDVAQSLRVRNQKEFIYRTERYQKYRPIYSLRPKQDGFVESPRCATLEGGFSLWQEYMDQAAEMMEKLPQGRVLKLRYEDLLEDPIPHLRASAEFCDLEVSNEKLESLTTDINSSRAYSYRNNPELQEFADAHQLELKNRGYE